MDISARSVKADESWQEETSPCLGWARWSMFLAAKSIVHLRRGLHWIVYEHVGDCPCPKDAVGQRWGLNGQTPGRKLSQALQEAVESCLAQARPGFVCKMLGKSAGGC